MSRVQDDPNRRCLKVQEWPPTDRALWQRILVTGNPFQENGAAAHWCKDTCHKNRKGYGRWLTFLSNHGIPLSDEPPGDRVAPKNVRAYLDELVRHEVSTYTRRNRLLELYAVISAMHPDRHWQWLREAAARIERAGAPKTAKRERIISTQKILHSGLALMEEARSMAETDQRYWKARYRDGLMISLLALRPLRRRNFAAIEIGRHLVVMTGGLTTGPGIPGRLRRQVRPRGSRHRRLQIPQASTETAHLTLAEHPNKKGVAPVWRPPPLCRV